MAASIKSRVTTSHWGAFSVLTDNNRIIGTEPFAADPNPSRIPESLAAAVHHKTRVARPSFRRGWLENSDRARARRGCDEFVELPWDEALDVVAAELQRVIAEHGNGSIFGGSYGWASAGITPSASCIAFSTSAVALFHRSPVTVPPPHRPLSPTSSVFRF